MATTSRAWSSTNIMATPAQAARSRRTASAWSSCAPSSPRHETVRRMSLKFPCAMTGAALALLVSACGGADEPEPPAQPPTLAEQDVRQDPPPPVPASTEPEPAEDAPEADMNEQAEPIQAPPAAPAPEP